jgi:tetratricopeptide (TPR) repeat protein
MSKGFNLKAFEEKADKEGLTWEMKEQFERAHDAYNRLLAEAEAFSPRSRFENDEKNAVMAYLLMRKAGVLLQTGKAELGEQIMHQALDYAEKSNNSLIIARAKLGVGVFYGSTNRFEEAEKLLTEALSFFGRGADYDSKQGYGWVLLNLGGLYGKQGKWIMAEQKLAEAIKLLEAIENWVGVASAYELKASHETARGDAELAKKDLLRAISFYERQGMMEKADSLRKGVK